MPELRHRHDVECREFCCLPEKNPLHYLIYFSEEEWVWGVILRAAVRAMVEGETEACAQQCDRLAKHWARNPAMAAVLKDAAEAIRAR